MNYLQAVAEVTETVKRPDKINIIRREINAAISFYCLDTEFPRDYAEQNVLIDATQFTQAIPLSSLTRFRKIKYIKRGGTKDFLTRLSDSEMTKNMERCNKFYEVGSSINVSLRCLSSSLDIGFYTFPPILVDDDEFWLLDVAPFMVIDRASGAVFKDIGDEKSYQTHTQRATEAYMAFRRDQLNAQ